jgi:hypothetical protein
MVGWELHVAPPYARGWDGTFGVHPKGRYGPINYLCLGFQSHANCGPP